MVLRMEYLKLQVTSKNFKQTNFVKTGPDRPVQLVEPGTGRYTGPISHTKHQITGSACSIGSRSEPDLPVDLFILKI